MAGAAGIIGRMIVSRAPYAIAVAWLVIAALLGVMTLLTGQPGFAAAGLLPALIGVVLLLTRVPTTRFTLMPESIVFAEPRMRAVRYDELRAVVASGSKLRATAAPSVLWIHHQSKWIAIPRSCDLPFEAVVEFVLSRAGWSSRSHVTLALKEHHEQQVAAFGADRVFHFRGMTAPPALESRRILGVSVALWICLVVWFAVGANPRERVGAVIGSGICGLSIVAIGALAAVTYGRRPSELLSANLVISPAGIALSQGDVRGALAWKELIGLKDVVGNARRGSFTVSSAHRALRLLVEGAFIDVLDVYDRPLWLIARSIDMYWRGVCTCPVCRSSIPALEGPGCAACLKQWAEESRTASEAGARS